MKSSNGRRRARPGFGIAIVVAWLSLVHVAHAQYFSLGKGTYPLEFYDIDFTALSDPDKRTGFLDSLHYIPMGLGADSYLSLGGEFREQYWNQVNESHDLRTPARNSYDLQRVVADAYLHVDSNVAIFGQIARDDAFDKISPSTTDETRGRLQQGFVELKEPVGAADVVARLGRQEITLGSGRFVWINDSSNVRTTQDGAHLHADFSGGATVDLIASRPVTPTYTAFADWSSHSGSFGALYASEPVIADHLHVDEYYFYRRNPSMQYASLTGNEDRDTFGGRIWGAAGGCNLTVILRINTALLTPRRALRRFRRSGLLPVCFIRLPTCLCSPAFSFKPATSAAAMPPKAIRSARSVRRFRGRRC